LNEQRHLNLPALLANFYRDGVSLSLYIIPKASYGTTVRVGTARRYRTVFAPPTTTHRVGPGYMWNFGKTYYILSEETATAKFISSKFQARKGLQDTVERRRHVYGRPDCRPTDKRNARSELSNGALQTSRLTLAIAVVAMKRRPLPTTPKLSISVGYSIIELSFWLPSFEIVWATLKQYTH
jgi:hypothetical protein